MLIESNTANIPPNNMKEKAVENTLSLYLSLLTYNLFDAFTVDLNAKASWVANQVLIFGRFREFT